MPDCILLLDVGNTNTKIGLADSSGILASYSLPTDRGMTSDSWGLRILDILRLEDVAPGRVDAWVVSSVVPPVDPLLTRAAGRFCGCRAMFASVDLPIPLENRYERPQEVGADRLVAAYAARTLFQDPSLVVVDYGTATTFDCVSGQAYLGGLICPGVLSSVEALASRTSKLPRITLELDGDEVRIGRSTFDSLNQGVIFGFAAMTDGIAARLKGVLPGPCKVVATGGFAERLKSVSTSIDEVRPALLLEGLFLIYGLKNT